MTAPRLRDSLAPRSSFTHEPILLYWQVGRASGGMPLELGFHPGKGEDMALGWFWPTLYQVKASGSTSHHILTDKIIHVHKNLIGGVKKTELDSSEVPCNRTRGNGHKMKYRKFSST